MPRVQIDVSEDLHQKVDQSTEAIVAANDERHPAVMVRGNEMVRMTERGELEPFNTDSVCDLLSSVATYGSWHGEEWKSKDPPRNVANALLARDSAQYVGVPRVDRVVDVPVLSWSGRMVDEPGLDHESRTYLRPAEGLEGAVGEPEHVEDVEAARELLLTELLGDFGFADDASRAHALSLILLPFVRDYIPGQTPMHVVLAPDIGSGKAQPLDEPVATPGGWAPIGDLRPGDDVIGSGGGAVKVLSVHPQGRRKIVRVTFSDGSWARCDRDHLWEVRGWKNGKPVRRVVKASDLMAVKSELHSGPFIPMAAPVERQDADLDLDPYLLGLLLGDGTLSTGGSVLFSSGDAELRDACAALSPTGAVPLRDGISIRLSTERGAANRMVESLRSAGLMGCRSHEKFVPPEYLRGSAAQRLAVLQGLMDTDGCASGEFSTTSPRLAADVRELVESLGGTAKTTSRVPAYPYKGVRRAGRVAYRVAVRLPAAVVPFRLARKATAWTPASKYPPRRLVESVVDDGEDDAVCIRVAAADGLYLTRGHVATHNTTLAQACLMAGCGQVSAMAAAGTEEEWRKRITASLLGGAPAILLDNLSGELDSPALAAALTTGKWSDRVLGESREVHLRVRNIWAATGNNLGLSAEQVRRAIPIFLDPGETRPSDRERNAFRHPDLLGWAERNRRQLVEAALTLVEHWHRGPAVAQGGYEYQRTGEDPLRGRKTLGSFESWAAVMGGVLESAGVPGFLENREKLKTEADDQTRESAEFMRAWKELFPEPLELRELVAHCGLGAELHDFLPVNMPRGDTLQARVGYWLREHKNARVEGMQLIALDGGRRRRWQVR